MRYMQSMGTFEYASQLYRSILRFFFGASKEVSTFAMSFFADLEIHMRKKCDLLYTMYMKRGHLGFFRNI